MAVITRIPDGSQSKIESVPDGIKREINRLVSYCPLKEYDVHRSGRKSLTAERACWLADLTQAIDEAQRVAWRLSSDGSNPEAMDLYVRLELARTEVESLRGGGSPTTGQDCPSEWIEFHPESLKIRRSWS